MKFIPIFIVIFFVSMASFSQIIITAKCQTTLEPGVRTKVEILISKNDLRSYSKFEQKFQEGISVSDIYAIDAETNFSNNTLTFTWTRLPISDNLRLEYYMLVDKKFSGSFDLNGEFINIEANKLSTTAMPLLPITVAKPPKVLRTDEVEIETTVTKKETTKKTTKKKVTPKKTKK